MKKGQAASVLIIVVVVAVIAAFGLIWAFSEQQPASPTGGAVIAQIGSGNIPLSISGTVFCPALENKLLFVREDLETYGGNVKSDASYRAPIKLIESEVTTEFDVYFKDSMTFIEQISLADTGEKKQVVDLACAEPTPEPTPTPEQTPEPTSSGGLAQIGSGNIPLSISGLVFCPVLENKLEFVREDFETFGGNVKMMDGSYKAHIKLIEAELTTEFDVFFKNSGEFIQQISLADTGEKKRMVDLFCPAPTPEPTATPVPTEEPTPVPTTPPPTEEPTPEPTGTPF